MKGSPESPIITDLILTMILTTKKRKKEEIRRVNEVQLSANLRPYAGLQIGIVFRTKLSPAMSAIPHMLQI